MNLNKGKIIWQVPFGEYQKLSQKGVPITGTENYGGATATAGNIIFATGTVDKKIRAFDSTNGKEVWSYQLEFAGSGPPSIYSINGEQYVIVASTGSLSLSSGYPEVNFGNLLYSFKIKE
jgi:quinoprotein glucose dehydrogenase